MTGHYHAVVWVDHHQARLVFFNLSAADETVIRPEHEAHHIHAKAGSPAGTHLRGSRHYFAEIANALAPAGAILITGPSTAKVELTAYLRDRAPRIHEKLAGVETADKMSDPELIAFARRYFTAENRMTPQAAGHP